MASQERGTRSTNGKSRRWRSAPGPRPQDFEAKWWPDRTLGDSFQRWTNPPSKGVTRRSIVPELLVEKLTANGIDAVGTAPQRSMPPIAPPDSAKRIAAMVDRLATHGPGQESPDHDALLRIGEEALPALRARFPGRLWFSRWESHQQPPHGRDVSGLCRTLVAFGEQAVPYVSELLEAEDANTRYYATLVAIDLGHPAFLSQLPGLLFDEDQGTARLGLRMLKGFEQLEGYPELLAGLREAATSKEVDERCKLLAIRALAVIRDQSAVEPLIGLISGRGVLSEAARRVLRMLTLQDFGDDQALWRIWYSSHRGEPRRVWLLRGLEHPDPQVREIAKSDLGELHETTQPSS